MIPDFKTYIGESIWNDIRRRGNGSDIKKEDDIDSFDRDEMYDYLINYYKVLPSPWNVYEIKNSPEYGRITVPIAGNNNCTMYFDTKKYSNTLKKLTGKDWEYANLGQMVCINYTLPYSFQKGLLLKLEDKFTLKSDKGRNHIYYIVSPKDGSKITNSFFIEVINFILDNAQIGPSKAIERIVKESIWNDIRRRGNGSEIKKEDDIDLLDIDGLYDYIDTHYKQSAKGNAFFERKQVRVNDVTLSVPVLMDYSGKDNPQTLYLSIKHLNTETYISISPALKDWAPDLYNFLKYHFTLEDVINKQGNIISSHYIKIKPKDGSEVTNTFFISLIDFLLERVKDSRICKLIEKI